MAANAFIRRGQDDLHIIQANITRKYAEKTEQNKRILEKMVGFDGFRSIVQTQLMAGCPALNI